MTAAMAMINLRQLKSTPVPVVVMWYALTVVVIGGSVLPILDRWTLPTGIKQWGLLVAIGAAGVLCQFFLTTACKYESPGPISVASSFNIVLAFIWEVTIFHEPVQWQSITGAVLISSCVVITALNSMYEESPEKFVKVFMLVFSMRRNHETSAGNHSGCNNNSNNSKPQLDTIDGQLSYDKSVKTKTTLDICLFQFIFYFIITIWKQYPIFGEPGHRWDLFMRCIAGTTSSITLFTSYRLMPLSDATTIYQTSPIFVIVFAYLILRDRPNVVQLITGIIAVIGIFIISKPEFVFGSDGRDKYDKRWIGIILSLMAAITVAMALINLRKLKSTPVPVVVMWYSVTVVVIGGLVLSILDRWTVPTGIRQWSLLVSIGATGVLNQYFQTTALKYESPGPISVTQNFNIVLAFIWEVTIFHEPVQWQSITGAVLISSCVVITALNSMYEESPEKFGNAFMSVFRMGRNGGAHHEISAGNPSDCNNNSYDSKQQLDTIDGQLSYAKSVKTKITPDVIT
ncbi:unnamed protein product [Medioppia subpectinata]|uniref:EamA domain-containing protein n=1 Tax=Medioppia subpectinata TaxID=1979941 RepID=A0A7R9KMP9_9ACAR|nr:unnamed protein product [Medioppia subpectinata]CAG2105212.1 unnamed protein product [Medioppia subpectinata]